MKNFDAYVGIDWSGAKSVYTPSISVAQSMRNDDAVTLVRNLHHRYWSRRDVFKWIIDQLGHDQRLLIGIDCNFGYCYAVGQKQFGADYTYRDLWQAVDVYSNDDNFYASGFWGYEHFAPFFWTEGKQPPWFDTLALQRQTERQCIADGYGRPESPFKLFSAKQVGKGGMAGMRMAQALKQECGDKIAFWPFERDKVNQAHIVITEIFPRQFLKRFGFSTRKIRTPEELRTVINNRGIFQSDDGFSDHDADAVVTAVGLKYLCGDGEIVPPNVSEPPTMQNNHALCEGWIFGVGD